MALYTPLPGELSSNLGASVKREKERCLVHFKKNLRAQSVPVGRVFLTIIIFSRPSSVRATIVSILGHNWATAGSPLGHHCVTAGLRLGHH